MTTAFLAIYALGMVYHLALWMSVMGEPDSSASFMALLLTMITWPASAAYVMVKLVLSSMEGNE